MAIRANKSDREQSLHNPLTVEEQFFLEPSTPRQRQYEALRAYFVEQRPAKDVAQQFGYSPGAFRVLCHKFRKDPPREFFIPTQPGPKHGAKRDAARDQVIALRKKNYSVPDIHWALQEESKPLSTGSIWRILNAEGFSRLPRRKAEEQLQRPKADRAEYADVRQFSLAPRVLETRVGGLFLLLRLLADMKIQKIVKDMDWYGSKMLPAENAFLACLLLKLIGKERKSHIMDLMFDDGAALAVGLNVLPKTAYVSEYSERITHEDNIQFLHRWLKQLRANAVVTGESFNLDFQSLPYFGEAAVVEKHYVSMRSRRQKAVLVFLAQDAPSRVFCYSNADLRKGEEADEVLHFIDFWEEQTGRRPSHLVFDSKLTTVANLSKINRMNIIFVTLRRRTRTVIKAVVSAPASAWRKIELRNVARKFRTPKVIDQTITVKGYEGKLRQIMIKDLGHELPTILITNDRKTSCAELISRYALRMLIENAIADGIHFFHTNALSCSVAIRIDFDVLLTLVGQATYHMLAKKLRGNEQSGADVIFRKFIDTPAKIMIGKKEIEVKLNKRAHNPILIHSGLINTPFRLPWLQNRVVIVTLR